MTTHLPKDVASVIIKPRVTEKAAALTEANVYTFDVTNRADKKTVAAAIKLIYKVTPTSVAIVKVQPKNVIVRGKVGVKQGGRKAYVTLDKKDKIEFV